VAGISRKHCEFVIEDGSIVINDLGSSNGTYVNQDRIEQSQALSAGDLVSFGGLVFLVTVNGDPEEIDAEMMFEDGIPEATAQSPSIPTTVPASAPKSVEKMVSASVLDNDESSMMDFSFDFDDDDDQPPL